MRQRERESFLQTSVKLLSFFLLGCALFIPCVPTPVYADGGAPNLAYVAGARPGVDVIDIAQQRVASSFAVAGNPDMLLLSPDGSLLYVTRPGSGSVVALAAKTGQVICSAAFPGHPALLALSVDATVVYVAGLDETAILALNAQTCAQERSFQAPEPVHWLAATLSNTAGDAPRTQLWVAGTGTVSILDDKGQARDSIPVAGDPQFLCLPGALTAYVATRQGSVIALDMLTHRVIATLLTGGVFGAMDYNAVTGEIYIPDQRRKQLDVLAPVLSGMAAVPREPSSTWPVSAAPQAVAITNDGQLGFVALNSGHVLLLDLPGRSVMKSVDVGGNPRFIIAGAYPPPTVPLPVAQASSVPAFVIVGVVVALLVLLMGAICGVFWYLKRRKTQSFFKASSAKS
ncbi:MAG TPA: PQQ-binding-like beta-propeller repeat protein [Ktedonobacteraceae bacterium]